MVYSGEDLDTLAHRINHFLSPFEKKEEGKRNCLLLILHVLTF